MMVHRVQHLRAQLVSLQQTAKAIYPRAVRFWHNARISAKDRRSEAEPTAIPPLRPMG
jgi:hypothetical protein